MITMSHAAARQHTPQKLPSRASRASRQADRADEKLAPAGQPPVTRQLNDLAITRGIDMTGCKANVGANEERRSTISSPPSGPQR